MKWLLLMCLWGALYGSLSHTDIKRIHQHVDCMIDAIDPCALVGVQILDELTGDVIYEKQAQSRFIPASVIKILTAATALDQLGSEYQFSTRLMVTGSVIDGVVHGDCYLIGAGDPSLSSKECMSLFDVIKEVRGTVYIDCGCFNDSRLGPGWMWDEALDCDAVPISAINMDHNYIDQHVVVSPESRIVEMLQAQFTRVVLHGTFSGEGVCVAEHRSEPLQYLIKKMLQQSNNLYADCIFMKMQGGWGKGQECVRHYARDVLNVDTFDACVDGSGLSRYNLLSPQQINQILYCLRNNYVFRSALAVNGESGTLKYRLLETPGHVFGKTGTMTAVSAICGYVETMNHHRLIASICSNGYLVGDSEIKSQLEDKILQLLINL